MKRRVRDHVERSSRAASVKIGPIRRESTTSRSSRSRTPRSTTCGGRCGRSASGSAGPSASGFGARARAASIRTAPCAGAFATGGVPFAPARRRRRRDKPKLVVALRRLGVGARRLALLARVRQRRAGAVPGHALVRLRERGRRGHRALREPADRVGARARARRRRREPGAQLELRPGARRASTRRVGRVVDRRTTVVILGDGRTNYLPAGVEVVERLRARARAVLWLTPEGPASGARATARCSARARRRPGCSSRAPRASSRSPRGRSSPSESEVDATLGSLD